MQINWPGLSEETFSLLSQAWPNREMLYLQGAKGRCMRHVQINSRVQCSRTETETDVGFLGLPETRPDIPSAGSSHA